VLPALRSCPFALTSTGHDRPVVDVSLLGIDIISAKTD
jgi:hypothetical protein